MELSVAKLGESNLRMLEQPNTYEKPRTLEVGAISTTDESSNSSCAASWLSVGKAQSRDRLPSAEHIGRCRKDERESLAAM